MVASRISQGLPVDLTGLSETYRRLLAVHSQQVKITPEKVRSWIVMLGICELLSSGPIKAAVAVHEQAHHWRHHIGKEDPTCMKWIEEISKLATRACDDEMDQDEED